MTTALASRVTRLEKTSAGVQVPVDVDTLWTPRSAPQTMALASEADELYYGGAAGGGKTDLIIGAALTQHRRSVIFRREYAQHAAIIDRVNEITQEIADRVAYNGSERRWRLPGGRVLELGAAQHEDSVRKWRGRPHDGKFFDELPEFTEAQYLFFGGWARTTVPGQRVRRIGAGNPPTDADGEWVIQRWGPWLDPGYPNPALPGELRWFARIEGKDTECEDGTPFDWNGETLYPQSRTFIPAMLADNAYLSRDPSYRATLQALPEPLRSQLLYGDHTIGLMEDAHQVIPTAWVRAAQARWLPERPELVGTKRLMPQSCVSLDVAEGGRDRTVVARRYGDWVAELIVKPGVETPTPEAAVALVEPLMLDGGYAIVDADMLGGKAYGILRAKLKGRAVAYQGVKPTLWRDKETVLEFLNVRAAAYWALREALDPSNNSTVALPPDPELRAELCAARWERSGRKIKLEEKKCIKERLGRSPDKADAVVQAFWPHAVMNIPESYGIRIG